jgi:aspartyl-tRNA(Asn)/glutamyl-tRNA(Gln) amidotransferase subunit B
VPQRSKESAHDYRYFPEPDLTPIVIHDAWRETIQETLPELPMARRQRFETALGLSAYDAEVLTADRATADYFEETVAAGASPKPCANWIMGDLLALLSEQKIEIHRCKIQPGQLASLIALIDDGTISGKIAKDVLGEMFASGKSPKAVVEEKGLVQISDSAELEQIAREIVASHPGPAADFKSGKKKALAFLMGQMMKVTKGKANPQLASELIRREIDKT